MNKRFILSFLLWGVLMSLVGASFSTPVTAEEKSVIKLPSPQYDGGMSVEKALKERRSVRDYKDSPLTLQEVSQLLWATYGISDEKRGLKTAPSAGATYPLEIYLVAGNVKNLSPGIYKYKSKEHSLIKLKEGDIRKSLSEACLGQSSLEKGAISIVFSAVYKRTTDIYGERGKKYVLMDLGHAGENLYLQAVSLGLGTGAVGAFDDQKLKKIIGLPSAEEPLYVMPVGRKK